MTITSPSSGTTTSTNVFHVSESSAISPVEALRRRCRGRVLAAGDAGYDELVAPFSLLGAFAPVAVVEVVDASDVVAVVRAGIELGVEVSVQATGHGAWARDDRPATVLVNPRLLDEVTVAGHVARVGAGVRWAAVLEAAGELGLAVPAGSSPTVGVVGYLTGGGLSPVGRTTGWASDHVVAFEVVTGDGQVRRVTAAENPGLFWGLRGGKGALGIVTAVEIELFAQPTIVGGNVFVDAAGNDDLVGAWAQWSADLPEQASTSLAIMRLPEMPGVPAPLAGRTTISVRFAWTGDTEDGQELIDSFMAGRTALLGGYGEMPFSALGAIHADPVDPAPVVTSSALLRELTTGTVTALMSLAGPASDCPQIVVELRRLGGALARSRGSASAVCHRDAAYLLHTVGIGVPPFADPTSVNTAALHAALAPWTTGGIPPNFGSWSSASDVAVQYDAETLARLGTLAATYDPRGVLAVGNLVRQACVGPDVSAEGLRVDSDRM